VGGVGWKLSVHGPAPPAWVPSARGHFFWRLHIRLVRERPLFLWRKTSSEWPGRRETCSSIDLAFIKEL